MARFEIDINGNITEHEDAEVVVIEKTPEQVQAEANAQALAYLASTDWVEPYLIKHYLGLAILPNSSNKFVIEQKRQEARDIIK